ncbi:MAG: DUF4399 domain-containing protein [Pseudomonadota bacterium]|jgi:hypothetical protein|nr:DUF4399 domain-containing protein [Pseudomonadota bacterium]
MIKRRFLGAALFVAITGSACAQSPNQPPSAAQGVYFVAPADGATVESPFKVEFGVKGMEVKPAGQVVEGAGHHHLLINADSVAKGDTVPADAQHLHFGKGQTETELKLAPGTYRLTMQFADGYHGSYGKDMSATITVTVK